MADTPNGETVNQGQPKNDASNGSTPTGNTPDNAAEELRKQLEQAKMRENQLQNQIDKDRKEREERERKELEERDEWKTVAEREREKREALEREKEEADRKQVIGRNQDEVFKEFSTEVIDIAKEAGMTLNDTSDESKEKLRSTLTKLSEKMGSTAKPSANNPNKGNDKKPDRTEQMQEYAKSGKQEDFDKALGNLSWIQNARSQYEQ